MALLSCWVNRCTSRRYFSASKSYLFIFFNCEVVFILNLNYTQKVICVVDCLHFVLMHNTLFRFYFVKRNGKITLERSDHKAKDKIKISINGNLISCSCTWSCTHQPNKRYIVQQIFIESERHYFNWIKLIYIAPIMKKCYLKRDKQIQFMSSYINTQHSVALLSVSDCVLKYCFSFSWLFFKMLLFFPLTLVF